ncbi:MAG: TIGR03435 family protein [Acidobacteria bacterium]|nr:TIGR03435 family protein [Acidobacteriota bacterium]
MKRHRAVLGGMLGVMLAGTAAFKAEPQTKPLAFEVASIKPNASGDNRIMMQIAPGGRLNVTGATLRMLIRNAFRVQDFQIIGGPAWMSSDRFDIQAKAEENASQAQVNEMLQTLLAERFGLKFHKETRELPVYELVVAKNGPKLKESNPNSDGTPMRVTTPDGRGQAVGRGMMMIGMGQITGGGMTTAQLAQMLGNNLGRTVIDKTGLTGSYDIQLSWTPDPSEGGGFRGMPMPLPPAGERGTPPGRDETLPSLFTAIQDQLGLKIESGRGPVEVMVIDSAQKPVLEQ